MNEPPTTYDIRTLEDLVATARAIPAETVETLMRDLTTWLAIVLMGTALGATADPLFRWTDDGKPEAHITLTIDSEDRPS